MTGTVRRKKDKKNRWQLTVRAGYDDKGREIRKSKTVTAINKSEAQQMLGFWLVELQKYDAKSGAMTFKALAC